MKTRFIYVFPIELISGNDKVDPFEPSDWNDGKKLPENAKKCIVWAIENDAVYTVDNFVLDFNIGGCEEILPLDEILLFYPDSKFNDEIEAIKKATE